MRAVSAVRKVDRLGRVSLPTILRNMHNIKTDDPVEMYQEGENIIIKKYVSKCVFCGSTDKVATYKSKPICEECMDNLRK